MGGKHHLPGKSAQGALAPHGQTVVTRVVHRQQHRFQDIPLHRHPGRRPARFWREQADLGVAPVPLLFCGRQAVLVRAGHPAHRRLFARFDLPEHQELAPPLYRSRRRLQAVGRERYA